MISEGLILIYTLKLKTQREDIFGEEKIGDEVFLC